MNRLHDTSSCTVVVSSFDGENVLFFHCMKANVLYYIPTKY